MRFEKIQFRKFHLSFTLAAILSIALGLFLLLMPNTSRKLLCILLGAGTVIYGLTIIIAHLPDRHAHSIVPAFLAGVCALGFGIFMLIHPAFLLDFIFTLLALIVLITSINGIRQAFHLRSLGFIRWQVPLAASLATMLPALSMIFFPGIYSDLLLMICGALLTASGTCELLSRYYLSRYTHS